MSSKIEVGNTVSVKGLEPSVRMVVIGVWEYNDRGFGGDFRELFWLDSDERPHTITLQVELLELSGL